MNKTLLFFFLILIYLSGCIHLDQTTPEEIITENNSIYEDSFETNMDSSNQEPITKKYDLSFDITAVPNKHPEMIPYFEKYQPINNERHNPSIKTIQLKNALFVLFEKNKKVDKMINSLPHYKIEQGTIYSSSNRTQKLKAKIMFSEL